MKLFPSDVRAMDEAETLLAHRDFCPYLELKELLPNKGLIERQRFRTLFTHYYGLNVGGWTDEFRDKFFEMLFDVKEKPNLSLVLERLQGIKRKNKRPALPFSFASKLVGIHFEQSPICDKHVLAFFGKKVPGTAKSTSYRIEWCVNFINTVKASYESWATSPEVASILTRFQKRDDRLAKCHVVRLLDFLVWKAGNQKLFTK